MFEQLPAEGIEWEVGIQRAQRYRERPTIDRSRIPRMTAKLGTVPIRVHPCHP